MTSRPHSPQGETPTHLRRALDRIEQLEAKRA
jgi:hypothetical protein